MDASQRIRILNRRLVTCARTFKNINGDFVLESFEGRPKRHAITLDFEFGYLVLGEDPVDARRIAARVRKFRVLRLLAVEVLAREGDRRDGLEFLALGQGRP